MSSEVLRSLQEAHAFDPFPVRDDLGVYHVPFGRLGGEKIEGALYEACRRFERIAVVGESGTGKSSLTASVLGPVAERVAPVVVPVSVEPSATVGEPRAMFAHIAAVIARTAAAAEALSPKQREEALARLTAQRPVGRTGGRALRIGAGWMGANISADLSKQAGPDRSIPRSATETLEVVEQMLATIQSAELVPVLVFDDTDRWLSGSSHPDPDHLVRAFFGRVLPALAELRCSVVVAVHRRYLADQATLEDLERIMETRLEVPTLDDPAGIAAIIHSRVNVHHPDAGADLTEVMTDDALARLYDLYRTGLRGELRGVMRTAHAALADACDSGAALITEPHIDAAYNAWDLT